MAAYDVIVAGAGIIGLNIAYQLARRSSLRVLVLERGAGVGEGSTGASSAICRCRYTLDEVTTLAREGIHAYRHWQDYLATTDCRASFRNDGVLWMPGPDADWSPREHARLQRLGIASEVLDADGTRERFPALSTCTRQPDFSSGEAHDCNHGGLNLLETAGGYMDPVSAAQDLVDALRRRGVSVRFNAAVTAVDTRGGRFTAVRLASGETLEAGTLVNAAGPWCRELYRAAGVRLDWDLVPTRIQVLHRDLPEMLQGHVPVTLDMHSGIYFRTQNRGQQLIVSSVLEDDEREEVADPDHFDALPDAQFRAEKLHALHHRLPALDYRSRVTGYCGLYTVNRDDVHPLVGPTAIDGFWVANGFSGHGFKLGPAIGALVARALHSDCADFDTTLPLDFFSIDRQPIRLDSLSVLA